MSSIRKRLACWLAPVTLAAILAGCGGGDPSSTVGGGLPKLPDRPGPTQAEQRAKFLKNEARK
jgi:hypothetical protein